MKYAKHAMQLAIFVFSTLAIGPVSAFSIVFETRDGVPCSNGCGNGLVDYYPPLDPCGPGGMTVTDSSGAPSCEPIAQVAPELIRSLRNAATLIEYKLNIYKATTGPTSTPFAKPGLTLVFEPRDGIPAPQCTETSCQIPIASEDPCGEGGVTVIDPSGAPSCEPIAQIGPRVLQVLRYSADEIEYRLYNEYVKKYH